MTRLHRHRRGWGDLARLDPYWAILTEPGKRLCRGDPGQSLRSGEIEIENPMVAAREFGLPRGREAVW